MNTVTQEIATQTTFEPMYLHQLVDFLYEGSSKEIKDHEIGQILADDHSKGRFWERVLAKCMPHTVILERNAPHRDYDDDSDAKFAMLTRYASGAMQATISGVKNKIGDLRVCMCVRGQHMHRVYFMRIPYEYYSMLSGHPIKISFQNFVPMGAVWDRFQCSFKQVTAP